MSAFDNVLVVSTKHMRPVLPEEVHRFEERVGFSMPAGWVEFMTRFGEGTFCDRFYFYGPERILSEVQSHRDLWRDSLWTDQDGVSHWFFEGSEAVVTQGELQQAWSIGGSTDGDDIVFEPSSPDRVLLLPRHHDRIQVLLPDLSDLADWGAESPRLQTFQPFEGQVVLDFGATEFSLDRDRLKAEIRSRWGELEITHEDLNEWEWSLVGYAPTAGARIQALEDEGITHTIGTSTFMGSGERSLSIRIDCDEEEREAFEAFFADLKNGGLATWRGPYTAEEAAEAAARRPAVERACERLLEAFFAARSPVLFMLNGPRVGYLTRPELEAAGIPDQNDIFRLFEWRDGVDREKWRYLPDPKPQEPPDFVPGWRFPPFSAALSAYEQLSPAGAAHDVLFPLFENDDGYLGMDLRQGTIHLADRQGCAIAPVADSLAALLDLFAERFETGSWRWAAADWRYEADPGSEITA
jgi:hypothetical protein